ncbi:ribonucleotide reductase [Candidatus Campbellbacteria bacterium]|nr:MAG: ribonucleotide reductase [Candidatus Campbellbacteria bacterium]
MNNNIKTDGKSDGVFSIEKIIKRNGDEVDFDIKKIQNAIFKALKETEEGKEEDAKAVAQKVLEELDQKCKTQNECLPKVEEVQDIVEIKLMESKFLKTAKAYILYRNKRNESRKRDIFKKRTNLKPYEYPELAEYTDAIRNSYWIHTEFNYTSDIQDYKVTLSEVEKSAIKNSMMAISQLEIEVQTFWTKLYDKFPKPELGSVGVTFAESEVRHKDAYSHLLEILGLNEDFEKIEEIPVMKRRIDYLESIIDGVSFESNKEYVRSILLFSLFIENVSLFSQFFVIMSFNKHKNWLKGISNVVEATSKEETIHCAFGTEVINIVKNEEHPEWFDEEYEEKVYETFREAYKVEEDVIEWIYEKGDIDFVPKATTKEFIKNKVNVSLESIGLEPMFEIDQKLLEQTDWFDDEILATKHVDFFAKRSINYTKRSKSITEDDLF